MLFGAMNRIMAQNVALRLEIGLEMGLEMGLVTDYLLGEALLADLAMEESVVCSQTRELAIADCHAFERFVDRIASPSRTRHLLLLLVFFFFSNVMLLLAFKDAIVGDELENLSTFSSLKTSTIGEKSGLDSLQKTNERPILVLIHLCIV